jgi:hypothetical protein
VDLTIEAATHSTSKHKLNTPTHSSTDSSKAHKQPRRAKRMRGVGTPLHCTPHVAVVRGMIDGSLTTSGLPPGQMGCVVLASVCVNITTRAVAHAAC